MPTATTRTIASLTTYRDHAVILRKLDYGEADRIRPFEEADLTALRSGTDPGDA